MCKNSGFRSRIQKSYKKFGIESKNLIIFSESIPNLLPPPQPVRERQLDAYYRGQNRYRDSA